MSRRSASNHADAPLESIVCVFRDGAARGAVCEDDVRPRCWGLDLNRGPFCRTTESEYSRAMAGCGRKRSEVKFTRLWAMLWAGHRRPVFSV